MQSIHIKRYDHPESTGYAGTIEPEDGSWVLFIPQDGGMPELHIEVEVPEDEQATVEDLEAGRAATIKGYTPAIYLDDRVTVKPEAMPEECRL
jgi:hypothetical protein